MNFQLKSARQRHAGIRVHATLFWASVSACRASMGRTALSATAPTVLVDISVTMPESVIISRASACASMTFSQRTFRGWQPMAWTAQCAGVHKSMVMTATERVSVTSQPGCAIASRVVTAPIVHCERALAQNASYQGTSR